MSKRGGKNHKNVQQYSDTTQLFDAVTRCGCNTGNWEYWQTASANNRTYNYYIDLMLKLAVSRFRWLNLPTTCDERYLELMLVTQGMASIAFPYRMSGTFLSLQCAPKGQPNMYDRPNKWLCIGQNGTRYMASRKTGVVVFDNVTRYPLMNGIMLYANELTHIRLTKRMNRMHQQIPFILTGPQEKKQDMVNLYKQVAGGEPAVLASEDIQSVDFQALSTGVEYIGEELAVDETNVWNRVYTMLGIENSTLKQERQTEDEIQAQKNPATLIAESALIERRKAARELNDRFGEFLEAPIEVVWRRDNESENWNLAHNVKDQMKAGE